jgi:ABC-type nitrate/sulfonate/bicarbonate transport system permease component
MFGIPHLRKLDRYVVPILVLAGWEAFSRSGALPAALLPAPSTPALGIGRLGIRHRRQHPDLQRALDL